MHHNDQKVTWWQAIAKWQDQRTLWILGGLTALILELVAVYYFQEHLGQRPLKSSDILVHFGQ